MTWRRTRAAALGLVCLAAAAQAPLLQDGASTLRQARLDWTLGQAPLPPSSIPFLEVGWGGADAEGADTPRIDAEGLGQGRRGWGLGLQGRFAREGWSLSATALALRGQGHTTGILQRAALAYQTESGWRAALEQTPLAWGAGLQGGDLLGGGARPFPRLTLATPEATLPLGRWRLEVFAGRLEGTPPIPAWSLDRGALVEAQSAGLDLHRPRLQGGLLRAAFGTFLETSLGVLRLGGGQDGQGRPAPTDATRSMALAEARLRLPALATLFQARAASLTLSRSGAPGSRAISLSPGRGLGTLQLVWEGWDLGLEYGSAAPPGLALPLARPAYLAGFSTHGDPLGPSFGQVATSRLVVLGLPLFLEGQGRVLVQRLTGLPGLAPGAWIVQGEAQWRTPTGRIGASLASRRDDAPGTRPWGWACCLFQAFRVF